MRYFLLATLTFINVLSFSQFEFMKLKPTQCDSIIKTMPGFENSEKKFYESRTIENGWTYETYKWLPSGYNNAPEAIYCTFKPSFKWVYDGDSIVTKDYWACYAVRLEFDIALFGKITRRIRNERPLFKELEVDESEYRWYESKRFISLERDWSTQSTYLRYSISTDDF